MTNTDT